MIRQVLVIALTLSVGAFSALIMYSVWFVTDGLPLPVRGMVSLLSWIAGYSFAAALFWRVTDRISLKR